MNFTDEQRMIQDMVRKLAGDKIEPLAKEADEAGHSSECLQNAMPGSKSSSSHMLILIIWVQWKYYYPRFSLSILYCIFAERSGGGQFAIFTE